MPKTLLECIHDNSVLLGLDLANIGKKVSWIGHKVFFTHNPKDGWNVVKLNIFQLFLRKVFGCYKESHFNEVFKQWHHFKKENIQEFQDIRNAENSQNLASHLQRLSSRLTAIWSKQHLVAYGSSKLTQAQVFCFAEIHGDIKFREATAKIIKDNYREGDIILVEGLESGKIDLEMNSQFSKYYKNGNYLIQGWEPAGYEAWAKQIFRATEDQYSKAVKLLEEIQNKTPKGKDYTSKDLEGLKEVMDRFYEEYRSIAKHFLLEDNEIEEALRRVKFFYNKLEKHDKVFDQIMDGDHFWGLVALEMYELEKRREKVRYHHLSKADGINVVESLQKRNASLIAEIKKYQKLGKKVFVVGGIFHFLNHSFKVESLAEIKAFLNKHPHIIITRDRYVQKNNIDHFNPDLVKQGLKMLSVSYPQ